MSDKCNLCLLGLVVFSLLKGTTGDTHMFSSSGENVTVPCRNVYSIDCTSTTWVYYRNRMFATKELFVRGIKQNNTEGHERLSLGSDCSLKINSATEDDYGEYSCQQYLNGHKHGTDARVYLHVLQVSPATQTEIRPGNTLNLHCQLFSSYYTCDVFHYDQIQLVWKDQAGVHLRTDDRYKISKNSLCISRLKTSLLKEDNNKKWKCQVKSANSIMATASYTVQFKDDTATVIPVTITTNSEMISTITPNTPGTATLQDSTDTSPPVTTPDFETSTASITEANKICVSLYRVIIVIVEVAVFAAPTVILLQICAEHRRRATYNTQ